MKRIAIIGGGLSGTLCAIDLLKKGKEGLSVNLIEKDNKQLLKGAAYSSELPHQLLNVPVVGMSIFEDRIDHFWQWIQQKKLPVKYTPYDFVPRSLFGEYVTETFEAALGASACSFNIEIGNVEDIEQTAREYLLRTERGVTIAADEVIICTGNFPPQPLPDLSLSAQSHSGYIGNPWSGTYLNDIPAEDGVLLVGTGLTMVDQLLSLIKNGHKGRISLLSRRGFLPHAHAAAPAYELKRRARYDLQTVTGCLRWLRAEVALAEEEGANWISVVNAIRELTPLLWDAFDKKEKLRFMRHLRPYWEIHRHRIPAESLAIIGSVMEKGLVRRFAGRINQIDHDGQSFITGFTARVDKKAVNVRSKWIVNCTGPHANIRRSGSRLIQNLLEKNILDTDELGIGLVVKPDTRNFFIVGPPAKGTYWECTALKEIRRYSSEAVDSIINKTYNPHETSLLIG